MRKTLATLALAAVPALVLSACNGSSAVGPGAAGIPNAPGAAQHRMHHNDNGTQDLHAGGATFPAYAYNKGSQPVGFANHPQNPPATGSLFASYGGTGTIYYCLTGSGYGRGGFTLVNNPANACAVLGASPTGFGGRSPVLDFVGSDVGLTAGSSSKPGDCCFTGTNYQKNISTSYGQPFEFPVLGGPITYGFRPGDFSKQVSTIKLSTWTYCAVTNGTISDWNDPAITSDNGKSITGGVSQSITFYFRSDSSGTTEQFQSHLGVACNPGTWPAPYNAYPYESTGRAAEYAWPASSGTWGGPGTTANPNPNFLGESGNPGVLAAIQSTPYGTGYVEGAWAKFAKPAIHQMQLQNGVNKKTHGPQWENPTSASAVKNALSGVGSSAIVFGGASDQGSTPNALQSSTPWCQLDVPFTAFNNPSKGYPIVGISYLMFYANNNVHATDDIKLVNYMVSTGAQSILSKNEYAPLSSSIHTAVTNALNGQGTQTACMTGM